MTKSSKRRILWQRDIALAAQDRRGQSKHEAKQSAALEVKRTGEPYRQPRGIFSTGTMAAYIKQSSHFINWIDAQERDVKNLIDCRQYVAAYLDEQIAASLSAYTLHLRAYALCSMFDCEYQSFGLETLPKRMRENITRNRADTPTGARFTSERYYPVKLFCIATGARRGGVAKIKRTDIRTEASGDISIFLQEKGGKKRWALVLPKYARYVEKVFADSPGYGKENQYLFPKGFIPKSMPVHQYRAQYAQELYQIFSAQGMSTGELYCCRKERLGNVYDKGILMAVSKNLGHSRYDVVVSHYLYSKRSMSKNI